MKNRPCPCPNTTCARHGDCQACKKHHYPNLPYCQRNQANKKD